ncbi:hypothetical protein LX81_04087 [Palleronia aestuarii]|uniref:Uncharacterized protein n=1 Tax=Palleronia aestuarii TaxID=568105 RepID=A0A2W7MSR2_9RHOB|nr:hypothetical protein LX81_04087 [Palleronia aestuarii]
MRGYDASGTPVAARFLATVKIALQGRFWHDGNSKFIVKELHRLGTRRMQDHGNTRCHKLEGKLTARTNDGSVIQNDPVTGWIGKGFIEEALGILERPHRAQNAYAS